MYGIDIENGEKLKCPDCNSVFAVQNETEILYRNITLLHVNTITQESKVKCKQCKCFINLDLSGHYGRIIHIE